MIYPFQLANGGNLLLAGNGRLLLSGPLYRNIVSIDNEAISYTASINALNEALIELDYSQGQIETFPIGLFSLFNIALELHEIQGQGYDVDGTALGQASQLTELLEKEAEIALLDLQALGITSVELNNKEFATIVYDFVGQIQGQANIVLSSIEQTQQWQALLAIAIGQAVVGTLQANANSLIDDGVINAEGILNLLSEVADAITESYAASIFPNGFANETIFAEAIAKVLHNRHRLLLDGKFYKYVPEPCTRIKITRSTNQNSVTLNWVDGVDAYQILLQKSVGNSREVMSDLITLSTGIQTYTETVPNDQTVSYRLISLGLTGLKSKPSSIVYSTPISEIF